MTATPDCTGCPLDGTLLAATDGMGRRQFIARSTLLVAAAALAACGGDPLAPSLSGPLTITLSQYPALTSVGGVAVVTSGGTRLAVVHTSSGYAALSLRCPHEGGTINTATGGFLCSKHGARFDLNGTWTGGERTSNMVVYSTSYDAAAGTLTIS